MYEGIDEALADFKARKQTFLNSAKTAATSKTAICNFMQSCCNWDYATVVSYSNWSNYKNTGTYYLGDHDNGSILGVMSGGTEKVLPVTNVASATIISESNFKSKYLKNGTVKQAGSSKTTYTFSGDYFDVKKYNSSGKVIKDYNVRFWLSKLEDGSPKYTYDTYSANAKATIRWFFSKLPYIFDRIEEATGLRPGYPYIDRWNGAMRHIVWNSESGTSVSAYQITGYQSIARQLNIKPFIAKALNKSSYVDKTTTDDGHFIYTFLNRTNSSTLSTSQELLANAGGPISMNETFADTVCHEMMHYVQFMNIYASGNGVPTWVSEGWADLIRGALMNRHMYYRSANATYGTWGMAFFGYKVGSKTLNYDNILSPTSNYIDKDNDNENKWRHIQYAIGNAFYHFLCTSVINGWDQDYRKNKHSVNKDTVRAS